MLPPNYDELDYVLSAAFLAVVFALGVAVGGKQRRWVWVLGVAAIALALLTGKHAACDNCRGGFAAWKRTLGRRLIE